jgi:hypothetical protein
MQESKKKNRFRTGQRKIRKHGFSLDETFFTISRNINKVTDIGVTKISM